MQDILASIASLQERDRKELFLELLKTYPIGILYLSRCYLKELPDEILSRILHYLDYLSWIHLSRTCRQLSCWKPPSSLKRHYSWLNETYYTEYHIPGYKKDGVGDHYHLRSLTCENQTWTDASKKTCSQFQRPFATHILLTESDTVYVIARSIFWNDQELAFHTLPIIYIDFDQQSLITACYKTLVIWKNYRIHKVYSDIHKVLTAKSFKDTFCIVCQENLFLDGYYRVPFQASQAKIIKDKVAVYQEYQVLIYQFYPELTLLSRVDLPGVSLYSNDLFLLTIDYQITIWCLDTGEKRHLPIQQASRIKVERNAICFVLDDDRVGRYAFRE